MPAGVRSFPKWVASMLGITVEEERQEGDMSEPRTTALKRAAQALLKKEEQK